MTVHTVTLLHCYIEALCSGGEMARQQAQAEELTLRLADNKTGYYGVSLAKKPGLLKPYQAALKRGGKTVNLGRFATAEEAALCVARSPEGQAAAAARAAAAVPLTGEEARQQAQAEGLTLVVAENTTGYFAIAEEAALSVARSPEGRAAAAGLVI